MRLSLFSNFGAKNSPSVWTAFEQGLESSGVAYSHHDMSADVAVIWSMVWAGRMHNNRAVYEQFRASGRPVIVLEVGTFQRGTTWKMGLNGTGRDAYYGNDFPRGRADQLGLKLDAWQQPGQNVVIVCQRGDSEQWRGQPATNIWLRNTVDRVRAITQRPIIVRPHPRFPVQVPAGCMVDRPRQLTNTYDSFDFNRILSSAWAVINHNSGPAVLAVMHGIPVFCDSSSLAAPVANMDLAQLNQPHCPDREKWLNQIAYTEWTLAEIATGEPVRRLLDL